MKGQEQQRTFVMRRSRWSSFSLIGYVLFGLLLPAILLAHVFVDYVAYVAGYAEHVRQATQTSITVYEEEIGKLNADIAEAQESVAALDTEINALTAEIADLNQALQAKQNAKSESELIAGELEGDIVTLIEQIESLEQDKAALVEAKEPLLVALTNAQIAAGQSDTAWAVAVKTVKEKEIAALQAQKAIFLQRLGALDAHDESQAIANLNAEIDALEADIQDLNDTIDNKKTEIANNQTDINAKTAEYADQEQVLANVTAEVSKLEKELSDLKAEQSNHTQTAQKHQAEIDALHKAIVNAKPSVADLALELYELSMEAETLQMEIDVLAKELENANTAGSLDQSNAIKAEIDALKTALTENTKAQAEKTAAFKTAYNTKKEQEAKIALHEGYKANEEKAVADLADKITEKTGKWNELTVQKTTHDNALKTLKADITALTNTNTKLANEIVALEKEIQGLTTAIAVTQKRINGLDATEDAEEIAKINGQVSAIDATIAKLESGELAVNSELVEEITATPVTRTEETYADAVTALNVAKTALKAAEDDKAVKAAAVTDAQALVDEKVAEIAAVEAALVAPNASKVEKEVALTAETAKLSFFTTEIDGLEEQIQQKETAKTQKISDKEKAESKVEKNQAKIEMHESRKAALKKILDAKGNSLLCKEDVAIIKAFEEDDLYAQKPYKANETDDGLLTTTKILFETVGLGASNVELLTYILAVFAFILIIGMLVSTISKTKKAKQTCYDVAENIIQCRMDNTIGKKFVLSEDAVVRVKQSLKGGIFGYGTLIVTMGSGMAGEFSMRHVKSVRKMKRMLEMQIAQYGRAAVQIRTPSYPTYPQYALPQMQFPVPFPVPMMNMVTNADNDDDCSCPYSQPRPVCPYED